MSETLELVRFTVDPQRREDFFALRPAAIRALRESFGGLLEARLAEHDDGSFTDVVRWSSREEAERAAAGCMDVPATKAWIETIGSVDEMSHALVRDVA